ncbi:DUF1203 domain-containing protein [Aestuariibacter sp. AA17]|uniref:DUF1203 domain-containing protein n=1 Tax=Fluctibacter corallii TaxID=2984329 RepID=A0ABT3A7S3_9ALTE|nr:DUF1203 domain-containing protein [Aestuariibacter sp. AA17]MCV2884653.1 DUF1203 domain-containing protein [Aestuariibacter sp. AA17]
MQIQFQITPITLSIDEVIERAANKFTWLKADTTPGYPCRVSLQDAGIGERVLAVHFTHHQMPSPYYASGPIFIRENAVAASPVPNAIPAFLHHRQLSVRGYSEGGMLINASLSTGKEVVSAIHALFQNNTIQYLHIHNAIPGCFMCSVKRFGV